MTCAERSETKQKKFNNIGTWLAGIFRLSWFNTGHRSLVSVFTYLGSKFLGRKDQWSVVLI